MNNLQDDGWALDDLKYVELPETQLENYRLERGDILFNRTNSKELVGKCAVFREPGDWVFASYLIRVSTDPTRLNPQFATDFLSAPIGRLQIDRLSRQIIGMTNINAEEIRDLQIPMPPLEEQARLVAAMDAARAERQVKLAEAEAQSSGFGDYVAERLKIPTMESAVSPAFGVKLNAIRGGVFGPNHHAPQLRRFLSALAASPYPSGPMSDRVWVNPPFSAQQLSTDAAVSFIPMDAVADGATGEVEPRTRPLEDVRKGYTPFAEDDVLWAKITPCMENGKLAVARNLENGVGFGSTEFHVFRPRDGAVLPDYIFAFLSQDAVRRAARLSFTGSAGHQRVPTSFAETLPFPVPPLEVQREIVAELKRRQAETRRLRAEARAGWNAAKAAFEAKLLGGTAA